MASTSGGRGEKAVKAAKTTKLTSSTTSTSCPPSPAVKTTSDQSLSYLVSTGALSKSYEMKHMKVMLAERQLKVHGKKHELIERLENYVAGLTEPRVAPEIIPLGIPEGTMVRLHGLNAADYNDEIAVVKSAVNENNRQLVEIQGFVAPPLHNQIYIKPENMEVVQEE